MIDMGIFETDESQAWDVNENGQVIGTFKEGKFNFIFLWDEFNGLKIIDPPEGARLWGLKLNNKGQFVLLTHSNSIYTLLFWDPCLGFWELESSKNQINGIHLNDKGQVLGQLEGQIFFWDHGKKINITDLFRAQVEGKWSQFNSCALNNFGRIVFSAYKDKVNGENAWGHKSFLWKDGTFEMILPEMGWEISVKVIAIDDDDNMIVNLDYSRRSYYGNRYFLSNSRNIFAFCDACDTLRNGLPIEIERLPGRMKEDKEGKPYFARGLEIKKLFKDEFPYYDVSGSTWVQDQNSKGYVVGRIGTMYPGGYQHAFLAIPEKKDISDNIQTLILH